MGILQFVNFRLLLPGIRWYSCPVNFNDERRHIVDCPTGVLQRGGAATGAPRALTGRSATCAPHTPSSSHSAPPPRPSAWARLLGRDDHVTVVADAIATRVSGLPRGFDYARAKGLTPGAACSWDGESLTLRAGERPPCDARGDSFPVVVDAPRS